MEIGLTAADLNLPARRALAVQRLVVIPIYLGMTTNDIRTNRPKIIPRPPSVQAQRAAKRRVLALLSDDELCDLEDPVPADAVTVIPLAGIAIEETLARIISEQFPEAVAVIIVEDNSHDDPHGHVGTIIDSNGDTLMDGRTDTWHDLEWTDEVDELAWDLHYLARPIFVEGRSGFTLTVPIHV